LYISEDGQTRIPLYLGPAGSVFIVFTGQSDIHATKLKINGQTVFPLIDSDVTSGIILKSGLSSDILPVLFGTSWITPGSAVYSADLSDGNNVEITTTAPSAPVVLEGPWLVTFDEDRYAPDSAVFDSLISWPMSPDPGIQFFSGIASYHKTFKPGNSFKVNTSDPKTQQSIILDLGSVKEVAEVFINGRSAGIAWCEPYRIDISGYVKPGKNSLVIKVANVWTNRLCGDARLAPENRVTITNITRLPNAWSYPMETIPNEEYGLRESGLLGPVIIRFYNRLDL